MTTPRKATAARKAAPRKATARTTTAKPKARAGVVNFDAALKKKGKPDRFPFYAFEQEWTVKAPNQIVAATLFGGEDGDGAKLDEILAFLASYIVKPERAAFLAAAADQEDFGADELFLLMEKLTEAAMPGVPT